MIAANVTENHRRNRLRQMSRRFAVMGAVTCAFLLGLGVSAHAKVRILEPGPFHSVAAQKKAFATAVSYWNVTPCSGDVKIVWEAPKSGDGAYSTWQGSRASKFRKCKIRLNPGATYLQDYPMFCALLVHEVGHLNGHHHSKDPANIMYPTVTYIPSGCTR